MTSAVVNAESTHAFLYLSPAIRQFGTTSGVTTTRIASRGRIMHDTRMLEFLPSPPPSPCILSRNCRRSCTGRGGMSEIGGCKRSSAPGRCGTCGSFSPRRETRTPVRERSRKLRSFLRDFCPHHVSIPQHGRSHSFHFPSPPLHLPLYPASSVPCEILLTIRRIRRARVSRGGRALPRSSRPCSLAVILSPSREGGEDKSEPSFALGMLMIVGSTHARFVLPFFL
jgi:hypothetical protein